MEKLNIAEILRHCPKGMELDCTMYEDVYFDCIDQEDNFIKCYIQNNDHKTSIYFTEYGHYNGVEKSKCVIFPKGKTTWEGFQRPFKDGDVLCNDTGKCKSICIYKKYDAKNIQVHSYCGLDIYGKFILSSYNWTTFSDLRLATEEEKQKLFDAIKANGYKWNPETKTLEKLIVPKFKVGDQIVKRNSISNSWIVASVSPEYYGLKLPNGSEDIGVLPISEQDNYELISTGPKFKVGDRVKQMLAHTVGRVVKVDDKGYYIDYPKVEGVCFISFMLEKDYELTPNKFDVTTLKPFESRVLVRGSNDDIWKPAIWGIYNDIYCSAYPYITTYGATRQCIPYEDNQHLLGTTNDCDDYFKTWE